MLSFLLLFYPLSLSVILSLSIFVVVLALSVVVLSLSFCGTLSLFLWYSLFLWLYYLSLSTVPPLWHGLQVSHYFLCRASQRPPPKPLFCSLNFIHH